MNFPSTRNNYREKNIDTDTVEQKIREMRVKLKAGLGSDKELADFADVLYLNSSDPLSVLHRNLGDLTDQSVSSVAGSGEFTEVFLSRGAKNVSVFDISFQTLFYNELRLAVLRHSNLDEYQAALFSSTSVIEPSLYHKVRQFLSSEAQAYFDEMLKSQNASLFKKDIIGRRRRAHDGSFPSFVGQVIHTEEDYLKLRENARRAQVSFHLEDIRERAGRTEAANLTYLSNVPELMFDYELVRHFLRNGSQRVIFSMEAREIDGKSEIVSDQGVFLLSEGNTFNMGGMKARLMGFDANIPFSALLEFRVEDNPELG